MDTVILLGLIIGLTQVVKITLGLTTRWIPLVSLIIALGLVMIFVYLEKVPLDWNIVTITLVSALTSMGLWSGTKATIGK